MIRSGRRPYIERGLEALLRVAAVLSATSILGILVFLVYSSAPILEGDGLAAVFSWTWQPHRGHYGILPMVAGSLCLSLSALFLALPAGVGVCLFAHGLGPPGLARLLMAVVNFMTSIPTVVYAFVSAILLVPFLRESFSGSGYSLLAATLTLSLLILPTIVLLIDAWWRGIAPGLFLSSAALGLTRPQQLLWLLLPVSSRGIAVAAVLGFGRAVGDTMISLLVAGNAPQIPSSPFDSIRTLTAHIALMSEVDTQSLLYHSIFACGLILLVMTAGLNLAARWLYSVSRKVTTDAPSPH